MQFVMAGNDTQGLRYGTIETPEKYYLTWKEPGDMENPLHRSLDQLCEKNRFLEIIHDFIVFDAGIKKLCRHNQFFGVKAAQDFIRRREGGIIWHTQGSGKSLIMIWLAKWIREHVKDARVLVITDRTELDEQIEGDYNGVNEQIYRTKSGGTAYSNNAIPVHPNPPVCGDGPRAGRVCRPLASAESPGNRVLSRINRDDARPPEAFGRFHFLTPRPRLGRMSGTCDSTTRQSYDQCGE